MAVFGRDGDLRAVVGAVGLVVCAAGGALEVTDGLVTPLLEAGHRVAVTLTPTAASWFPAASVATLERLTGFAVRCSYLLGVCRSEF